jgi:hypothetical protein
MLTEVLSQYNFFGYLSLRCILFVFCIQTEYYGNTDEIVCVIH